ncbi:MAG: PIN domain-containing protein [Acidobacteriota bacterium]
MSGEFVDTNVLIYAYDPTNAVKHALAQSLLERLWADRAGRISVQVMQEFFNISTKKIPSPLLPDQSLAILRQLANWPVYSPGPEDVFAAVELTKRASVSFWDAMILVAAHGSGSKTLWTEDLNDGESVLEVEVHNPFRDAEDR